MPTYEYFCESCGRKEETYQHKMRPKRTINCSCGRQMTKMVSQVNTDIVKNIRFSSVMGVNPKRIPEAERLYPGSRYTPDGRLIVNSRKDKLMKMKQRNLVEIE